MYKRAECCPYAGFSKIFFNLRSAPAVFDETQLIMAGDQRGTYQNNIIGKKALHCISVPYPKPGRAENTENTSALSKAWFGVWDTDSIPQVVFLLSILVGK